MIPCFLLHLQVLQLFRLMPPDHCSDSGRANTPSGGMGLILTSRYSAVTRIMGWSPGCPPNRMQLKRSSGSSLPKAHIDETYQESNKLITANPLESILPDMWLTSEIDVRHVY